MPITIGSNIAAIQAQRRLSQTTTSLRGVFEHLSSGLRINRAADDAAGLAVADSLKVDTRVALQGVRNVNDALSLTNIADGATNELSNIIVRLRELAEQSANGTLGDKQRVALDAEAQSLSNEYTRIAQTTSFNGLSLFNGSTTEIVAQSGYGFNGGIRSTIGGTMGNGTFVNPVSTSNTGSTNSVAVALADLNGDGILDIAEGGSTNVVRVSLGTGSGSFGASSSYSSASGFVAAIDFSDVNNDGVLDLLSAGRGASAGEVLVRIGIGDGTFKSAVSYAAESTQSNGVSVGDLNGDGFVDLVTAGKATSNQGYATVRLGRGDGTFNAAFSYLAEALDTQELTLGDLNGDSVLDLVTAGYDGSDGYATVRLGTGSGTFQAAVSYSSEAGRSESVALGDANGDGKLDLITSGRMDGSGGFATVRLGAGDGTFRAATSYSMDGVSSLAVGLADVNANGVLDLITAGGAPGTVSVRFGLGDGTFQARVSYAADTAQTTSFALGDLNGDSVLDIITAGSNGSFQSTFTVQLGAAQSGIGPLLPFSLRTLADSRQAMAPLKRAQENLLKARGTIGAFQSRLGAAVSTVTTSAENFSAAESQLRDVDVADEASRLVRLNILQQAGAAILAQSSTQPALALTLLSAA